MTHCPPYRLLDSNGNGNSVGSTALAKRLESLPNLKLHVFGHIHESFGVRKVGNTTFANVAHVDGQGRPRENGWLEIDL